MKLAQALQTRADLNRHLSQLKDRLIDSSLVQDGEKPAEDPMKLIQEMEEDIKTLESLVTKINLTNSKTMVEGTTLTALLSKRDALRQKIQITRAFVEAAREKVDRYTAKEIIVHSTVDVGALQGSLDYLEKKLRLTTDLIEETNWTTELLEEA